ncbi:MAG: hypothetical protein ACIAQZ_17050 [Sedimentisphaeraceae bacterium JB056]
MIWQIIKKEIWHNRYWTCLALGFVLFFTIVIYMDYHLDVQRNVLSNTKPQYYTNSYSAYSEITGWDIWRTNYINRVMSSFSLFYFLAAIGLGILIAVNQFWVPFFTNTWKFTLHRPIKRWKILTTMIFSAVSMLTLIGCCWTVLVFKIQSELAQAVTPTSLAEGWMFVLEGFLVYLAVALTAFLGGKWYTSRPYPVLLLLLCLMMIWQCVSLVCASIIAMVYIVLIISVIYSKFETREF